jgi:hypothetical protein
MASEWEMGDEARAGGFLKVIPTGGERSGGYAAWVNLMLIGLINHVPTYFV